MKYVYWLFKGYLKQVHYQDEDKETLYLSQERVRLYMSAKENLPLPSMASLGKYAEGLRKEANRALAANKGQKLGTPLFVVAKAPFALGSCPAFVYTYSSDIDNNNCCNSSNYVCYYEYCN
jgi:hypothetical protein